MNENILKIVRAGNTMRDLPQIIESLKGFDDADIFNSLFPLSVQQQGLGKGVAFAAYSLNELNPCAQMSAEEAVSALLPQWDVSIEEVVYYLSRQFGKRTILRITEGFKANMPEGEPLIRVKTIEYWLAATNA